MTDEELTRLAQALEERITERLRLMTVEPGEVVDYDASTNIALVHLDRDKADPDAATPATSLVGSVAGRVFLLFVPPHAYYVGWQL